MAKVDVDSIEDVDDWDKLTEEEVKSISNEELKQLFYDATRANEYLSGWDHYGLVEGVRAEMDRRGIR